MGFMKSASLACVCGKNGWRIRDQREILGMNDVRHVCVAKIFCEFVFWLASPSFILMLESGSPRHGPLRMVVAQRLGCRFFRHNETNRMVRVSWGWDEIFGFHISPGFGISL